MVLISASLLGDLCEYNSVDVRWMMRQEFMRNFLTKKDNQFLLAILGLWCVLWLFPWPRLIDSKLNIYLTFILGFVQLIFALFLILIPGMLVYFLLTKRAEQHYYLGALPAGFSFSVALIGIIGLIGKVVGFSFGTVKILFFLAGLFLLTFAIKNSIFKFAEISACVRQLASNSALSLALFVSFVLSFSDTLFFIDDLTYLAHLTNWQYSVELGFQNIIHDPIVLEIERFWLAMYPMSQAILSDLSGVPGIVLFSNYLELVLAPLAVLSSYWLARVLGLSRNAAGFSVLIQVSFYSWMIGEEWPVGKWFYNSLPEDKVSAVFHFAPVFFVFVVKCFENMSWKNVLLITFAGIALALTHPVSLFYVCFIVLCWSLLVFVLKNIKSTQLISMFILVVLLMFPYIAIRVLNVSSQAGFTLGVGTAHDATYQLNRYVYKLNNMFYGLNPRVLMFIDLEFGWWYQIFRLTPIFVSLSALYIALLMLKKDKIYQYIFCSSFLVVIATIPYTGWIIGYLTDARLISRASWFLPLGLATVVLFQSAERRLMNKFSYPIKFTSIALFACFLFVLPVFLLLNLPRLPGFFAVFDRNLQLAEIGRYIDVNSEEKITSIGVDYIDMVLLPGVSAKTNLISFREENIYNGHNHYLTEDEIKERIYASTAIRSLVVDEEVSVERCLFIKKFDVRFVVISSQDVDLYFDLVEMCGIRIDNIYQTENKVLLRILP